MSTNVHPCLWYRLLPLGAFLYVVGLLLMTQPAAAFVPSTARTTNRILWQSPFTYDVATDPFSYAMRYNISQAAFQWDDVNTGANFNVDELCCGSRGENVWIQGIDFGSVGFDPNTPGVTVNHLSNAKITYSTIYANNRWNWDGGRPCTVDFTYRYASSKIVLTHEFGHTVGLSHDRFHPEAVMWPDQTCKLTTVVDDDLGVRSLYGNR